MDTMVPHGRGSALPIDEDVCFSDAKGRYRKGIEKERRKLLSRVEPLLRNALEPGETIRFAAVACSPYSVLELLTTGWAIQVAKRCILVVTDRRILHFPTRGGLRPRNSVAQARFSDLGRAKLGQLVGRKLVLTYSDGSKESFTALRAKGIKRLRDILPDEGQLVSEETTSSARRRHHLCPRCSHALAPDTVTCTRCSLPFKPRSRGLLWALVVPGGGYFYTGHPFLGLADAVVEAFLLILGLSGVLMAFEGDPEGWLVAIVFFGLLVIEKAVTIYHTKHYLAEFPPAEKEVG